MLHSECMRQAIAEAEKNLVTNDGGPFGAVIVRDGQIIGRGRNQVLAKHDPTCHAEVAAIRDACHNLGTHDLRDAILYTSCYPCPMCLSATIWANIKTVYYGNTAADAADIGFRDEFIYKFIEGQCQSSEVLSLTQLGYEETLTTFSVFKGKADKMIY